MLQAQDDRPSLLPASRFYSGPQDVPVMGPFLDTLWLLPNLAFSMGSTDELIFTYCFSAALFFVDATQALSPLDCCPP